MSEDKSFLKQLLTETWPARMAQDALKAVMLPGDVYQGKVQMYGEDGRTNPEVINRSADLAGLVTLGAGAVPAEANSLRAGIKAYHGSPHDFDRFDLSKIGTGEGAQAYGHGLYFADNEATAKSYRDNLSTHKLIQEYNNANPANRQGQVAQWWASGMDLPKIDEALKVLEPKSTQVMRDSWIRQGQKLHDEMNSRGKMYEVNINADPAHFLDWDKPLHDQSQFVRDAIAKSDSALSTKAPDILAIQDPEIRSVVRRAIRQNDGNAQGLELAIDNDSALYNAAVNHAKRNKIDLDAQDMRASDYIYQHAKDYINALSASQNLAGDMLGKVLGVKGGDMMQAGPASARLRDAGLPGIKYLDQGSRGAGEGSRNYVVFDDNLIDILKKYGLAGASASPLAALMAGQGQGELQQ